MVVDKACWSRWTRSVRRRGVAAVLAGLVAAAVPLAPARAGDAEAFAANLDPARRKVFEDVRAAEAAYDFAADGYWSQVNARRLLRRTKRAHGEPILPADYVMAYPPEYRGPPMPGDLARAFAQFRAQAEAARSLGQPTPPPPAERPIPTLTDVIESARAEYAFAPDRIPEREFKVRYARAALSLGLSKEQVVRIYALETGGQGTADMQAGINPITRKGHEISTALGYAQLLNANSVEETAEHGATFLQHLRNTAAATPGRGPALRAKSEALRKMIAAARSVPDKWDEHVAFAATPKGLAIHALNLDGDVGPLLQVVKLRGLKDYADKAGRTRLAGNEIELMNLAGPGTGLEMMTPTGLAVPTPNFFSRVAYGRNSVVRGRTSAELLVALDKRMDENIGKPGAIEFGLAFDEAQRGH
jgi:hypothetical protein